MRAPICRDELGRRPLGRAPIKLHNKCASRRQGDGDVVGDALHGVAEWRRGSRDGALLRALRHIVRAGSGTNSLDDILRASDVADVKIVGVASMGVAERRDDRAA